MECVQFLGNHSCESSQNKLVCSGLIGLKSEEKNALEGSCLPPRDTPITCNCRFSVQPMCSRMSIMSLAISLVEYLTIGLSLSPTPARRASILGIVLKE